MDNNFLISRRQLGQVFIVSALAGVSSLVVKASYGLGQNSSLIYGIKPIPGSRRLALKALNLKTGKTQVLLSPIPGVQLQSDERITTFAHLSDNSFLIATAPIFALRGKNGSSLISFKNARQAGSAKPSKKVVPALAIDNTIEGIVENSQNQLLTLVNDTDRRSPDAKAKLMAYDLDVKNAGKVIFPSNKIAPSLSVLGQGSDGKLYTISVEGHGHHAYTNTLWSVDISSRRLQKLSTLKFKRKNWTTGIRSLVSHSSGLYALGSEAEVDINGVYKINPQTGEMKSIASFDVCNIAV